MDLVRTYALETYAAALSSWRWIGLEGLEPWFSTAFGDVFLVGDDAVHWLDVTAGELSRPFADTEEAKRVLATDEGLDEYLMAGLAFAAQEAGLVAEGTDILDFEVPPVLGGEFEVGNLKVADFHVAVHRAGQLHEQVKDLPEGAEVTGFDIDGFDIDGFDTHRGG